MKSPVLITGTSTGIGRAISLHLAANGTRVYATVRREEDHRGWDPVENVVPLILDVTRPDEIEEAVGYVAARESGLGDLVNNS